MTGASGSVRLIMTLMAAGAAVAACGRKTVVVEPAHETVVQPTTTREVVVAQPTPTAVVSVQPAPPPAPPPETETASPGSGYVWVPGAYEWRDNAWQWTPGRWVKPAQPAAVWEPGHWQSVSGGYVWQPGHWR